MLLGFYSSAQCVPVAARVEQLKKFMFITTCISSAVLENRNLKYVFRAQPSGSQFGELSMDFIAQNAKAKLGKDAKDLRIAIIHEDGAYGVDAKLKEGLGKDVDYIYNVDPISIWSTNEKALDAKLPPLIKMVGEEYEKAKPGTTIRSAHVGMSASNSYVFFTEILPRAIKKFGGVDADALRKAALEVDLPEGGTMLGFGVKFAGEGSPVAGQNLRASPVITQYIVDNSDVLCSKT